MTDRVRELRLSMSKICVFPYEQDPVKVQEYLEQIKAIPENRLVSVDETGIDKYVARPCSRAEREKSVYGINR